MRNQPSLKRNVSVPSYLDASTGMDAGFARTRSRSDGAYLSEGCDDFEDQAPYDKASVPMFRSVPVSDIHGLQSHEYHKLGAQPNFEASESTYYAESGQSEIVSSRSERGLSDSVFTTPQASEDEQSLSYSHNYEVLAAASDVSTPGMSHCESDFLDPLGAIADHSALVN